MTPEQFAIAATALHTPHAKVRLGVLRAGTQYEIILSVQYVHALKCRVFVFVNGEILGKWLLPESKSPETAFMRRRARALYSKSMISLFRVLYGEKKAAERAKKKAFSYYSDFAPGKSALDHIERVSDSVELLSIY